MVVPLLFADRENAEVVLALYLKIHLKQKITVSVMMNL